MANVTKMPMGTDLKVKLNSESISNFMLFENKKFIYAKLKIRNYNLSMFHKSTPVEIVLNIML
jgi:hypothetical protein